MKGYRSHKFKTHKEMDAHAARLFGKYWVARVNRPGTLAGSGRWHHHQYKGIKNYVIEDTLTPRLYIKKRKR